MEWGYSWIRKVKEQLPPDITNRARFFNRLTCTTCESCLPDCKIIVASGRTRTYNSTVACLDTNMSSYPELRFHVPLAWFRSIGRSIHCDKQQSRRGASPKKGGTHVQY